MRRFQTPTPHRAKLRLLAGAAALAGIIAIGVLLVRNQRAYHLGEIAALGLKVAPEAAQRIQDFRRVKVKDSRKVWEVSAREARYLEERGEVLVTEPKVTFYLPDGRSGGRGGVISMEGGEGRLALEGRELVKLWLDGGIDLRFKDFALQTDRATFDQGAEKVIVPGPVAITGNGVSVKGAGMVIDVRAERVVLSDVESTFSGRDGMRP